jgi:hypothetical protein
MSLLLIDASVHEPERIIAYAETQNAIPVIFNSDTTTFMALDEKIVSAAPAYGYTSMTIFKHNKSMESSYRLLESQATPALVNGVESNDPKLKTWYDLCTFFTSMKLRGVKTIEFKGCEGYQLPDWEYIISKLAEKVGGVSFTRSTLPQTDLCNMYDPVPEEVVNPPPSPIPSNTRPRVLENSVIYEWKNPENITVEELLLTFVGSDGRNEQVSVLPTINSYTFNNLVKAVSYTCSIQAKGEGGLSGASQFPIVKPGSVPSVPLETYVEETEAGLTFCWVRPADDGNGELQWFILMDESRTLRIGIPPDQFSYSAALAADKQYVLFAVNAMGYSAAAVFINAPEKSIVETVAETVAETEAHVAETVTETVTETEAPVVETEVPVETEAPVVETEVPVVNAEQQEPEHEPLLETQTQQEEHEYEPIS